MKASKLVLAALTAAALTAAADDIAKTCPVSDKLRGHELTEWSMYNASAMIHNDRPRVMLVGDSIVAQYQGKVSNLLKGKAYMSYWASSYCVTSPIYLKLLEAFLDDPTKPYDVIHFNNGLHSLNTPPEAYAKRYREAIALIRRKAPTTKIIICTSTPLKDAPEKNERVKKLNEIAREVMAQEGVEIDDLYSVARAMSDDWHSQDGTHYTPEGYQALAEAVADCLKGHL